MIPRLFTWLWRLFRRTPKAPSGTEGISRAARLLYPARLMQRLQGRAVRFIRSVDRSPDFFVWKGQTGKVVGMTFDPQTGMAVLRVRLDEEVPGAEAFGNEVHWMEGVNFKDFEKDVVLLPE